MARSRRPRVTHKRLEVLRLAGMGSYGRQIARALNLPRSTVQYQLQWLEKERYLKRVAPGVIDRSQRKKDFVVFYDLTQLGTEILDRVDSGMPPSPAIRLHNVVFLYPVIQAPTAPVDGKRVDMMNWTQVLGVTMGLNTRFNGSSLEIMCGDLLGDDPYEILFRAREESEIVVNYFERNYNMKLGRPKLSRRPHFAVTDPVAEFYGRFVQVDCSDWRIDTSRGCGEIDFLSLERVADYINLPRDVKRLECKIDALASDVRRISRSRGEEG